MPCFVDATPLRVAGISGKGCFSRSLSSPTPILESEICAASAGIFYHLPYSNFIRLVGDSLAVLLVLRKGSCSSGNYFLQNLAKLYLKSTFLLDLRYIRSENNPADCLTRRVFPCFSPVWHAYNFPCFFNLYFLVFYSPSFQLFVLAKIFDLSLFLGLFCQFQQLFISVPKLLYVYHW